MYSFGSCLLPCRHQHGLSHGYHLYHRYLICLIACLVCISPCCVVSAEGSHEVVTSSARWSPASVIYRRFPRSAKKPSHHRKVGKKRKEKAPAPTDSSNSGKKSPRVVFITSFRGADPTPPCGLSRESACTSLNAAAQTLQSPLFQRATNHSVVFILDALPGQSCEIHLGSCKKVVFSTDHSQVFQSVSDSGCPIAKIHFHERKGCNQKLEVRGKKSPRRKKSPRSRIVTFLMLHFINPKIRVSFTPMQETSIIMRDCIVHIGSVNITETPIAIAMHTSSSSLEITNVTLARVGETQLVPSHKNTTISLMKVDCKGYCSVKFTNSTFRGFIGTSGALRSVVKVMYVKSRPERYPDPEKFFVVDGCKVFDMDDSVRAVFSMHMPRSADVSAVITGSVFANVSAEHVVTFTGPKRKIRNSNLQTHVWISINRCVFSNIPSDVIKIASIPAVVNLQLTDNTIAMVRGHFVTLFRSDGVFVGCRLFST